MPTPHPIWLDYATAIGPLLAVLVAVGVALMQYYLQRQQFKQDLYEKRFGVYEGVQAYVIAMLQTAGKTDIPAYQQFRKSTDPAEFLFGSDVWEYVQQIGKIGLDFRAAEQRYEHYDRILHTPLVNPDEAFRRRYDEALAGHQRLMDETSEFMTKVTREHEGGFKAAFRPYLKLFPERCLFGRLKDAVDLWMQQRDSVMASRYTAN